MARMVDYDQMMPQKKVKKSANLGTRGEPARIKMPAKKSVPESERPSEKMKKRMEEKDTQKSLSEALLEASAALPPGEGMIGKALKAGVSGAAAGATLGEILAKAQQEKMQRGRGKQKPRTMSEKVME